MKQSQRRYHRESVESAEIRQLPYICETNTCKAHPCKGHLELAESIPKTLFRAFFDLLELCRKSCCSSGDDRRFYYLCHHAASNLHDQHRKHRLPQSAVTYHRVSYTTLAAHEQMAAIHGHYNSQCTLCVAAYIQHRKCCHTILCSQSSSLLNTL